MRQLSMALVMYANDWKGHFPTNGSNPVAGTTPPLIPVPWYSFDQIGKYLPKNSIAGAQTTGKGVFVCPEDDGSVRSYALNYFAGSLIGGSTEFTSRPYRFKYGMKEGSRCILLVEAYSVTQTADYYYCGFFAGYNPGVAPPASTGKKFGGAGGFSASSGRFGTTETEIAFYRHKPPKEPGKAQQAKGRANFAFADGHVTLHKPTDLYDPATGKSNFTALWSPKLDYLIP
jgi:prepilin-type processing-associated H-X9-DG protein